MCHDWPKPPIWPKDLPLPSPFSLAYPHDRPATGVAGSGTSATRPTISYASDVHAI